MIESTSRDMFPWQLVLRNNNGPSVKKATLHNIYLVNIERNYNKMLREKGLLLFINKATNNINMKNLRSSLIQNICRILSTLIPIFSFRFLLRPTLTVI